MSHPLERLRHHVSGAIERGEKEAITEVSPEHAKYYARMESDRRFSEELARQFGAKATEMRYAWPKSEYDGRTRAAYEAFLVANRA